MEEFKMNTPEDRDRELLTEVFQNCDSRSMSFDLPLKINVLLQSNFAELSEDWDSIPTTPSALTSVSPSLAASNSNLNLSMNKKVRFDDKSNANLRNIIQPAPVRAKVGIEQLIQSATDMNDIIINNMDNINSFRSDLLSRSSGVSSTDNPKRSQTYSSMSNFELSEDQSSTNDDEECEIGVDFNPNFSFGDPINKTLSNELEENIQKFSQLRIVPQNTDSDTIHVIDLEHDNTVNDNETEYLLEEINSIPVENTISYFIQTFENLLELTRRNRIENVEEDHLFNFRMKSTATVSFQALLDRIQKKCEFKSVIYLLSTFILQTLFLDDGLDLKHNLDDDALHRLVIAMIRISCKLIQDKQFSHEYFGKVCGVSKKLLTKLEVSLLVNLKDDELMVRNKKLLNTISILETLKNKVDNYGQ